MMIDFSTDPFAVPGLIAVDVPGFDRFYVDDYHTAELRAWLLLQQSAPIDTAMQRWLDELATTEQQTVS